MGMKPITCVAKDETKLWAIYLPIAVKFSSHSSPSCCFL